jgi:catechol 2,3-dioxygenase-like lactoylglutathione lyase family enzyme
MHLALVAVVVEDYDTAIEFFVSTLGFDLVEDSPSLTNDGRPKRWVVVRPPGAQTGLLLARADGPAQQAAVGNQAAGRVGFFLRVEDFNAAYEKMVAGGVEFVTAPRVEPYGRVAVFRDIAGNRWDLLGSLAQSGPEQAADAVSVRDDVMDVRDGGVPSVRGYERIGTGRVGRRGQDGVKCPDAGVLLEQAQPFPQVGFFDDQQW